MARQQQIVKQNLERKVNKEIYVLIENITFDGKYYVGRTKQDAPDIDGLVYIKKTDTKRQSQIGDIVKCTIIQISHYDVIAEMR